MSIKGQNFMNQPRTFGFTWIAVGIGALVMGGATVMYRLSDPNRGGSEPVAGEQAGGNASQVAKEEGSGVEGTSKRHLASPSEGSKGELKNKKAVAEEKSALETRANEELKQHHHSRNAHEQPLATTHAQQHAVHMPLSAVMPSTKKMQKAAGGGADKDSVMPDGKELGKEGGKEEEASFSSKNDSDNDVQSKKLDGKMGYETWLPEDDYKFTVMGKPAVGECVSTEYRGPGIHAKPIHPADWKKLLTEYRHSKKLLLDWLKHSKFAQSPELYKGMVAALEETQLYRPPYLNLPDLSWRGELLVVKNEQNHHSLLLGQGFMRLLLREPKRAAFEMTRTLAQVWSPTTAMLEATLSRAPAASPATAATPGHALVASLSPAPAAATSMKSAATAAPQPWDPLLNCMGVKASESFSEKNWAIASSLAVQLSAPGCELKFFIQNPQAKSCLSHLLEQKQEKSL